MADTKISDTTVIAAVANGDKIPIADVSDLTATYHVTPAQLKSYVSVAPTLLAPTLSSPTFSAGSASAGSWPVFTSGTLLTTAEDGAIELDANCFYGCTDGGNRGYVPVRHFIRCDSTRTLPNDTNENAIFNSPANGRITLETGCYLFEALIRITGMSATSGNALIDILGAGTATAAAWNWYYTGIDATDPAAPVAHQGGFRVTQDSAASIVTATTGTGLGLWIRGTCEITAAGTLIPSIDLVTATAGTVGIGSYFMIERIGSTTVVSVGQWD